MSRWWRAELSSPTAPALGLSGFTGEIFQGKVETKPSEIVVETPNRFFLTINLATAKRIGLKIPRAILERADRLIE